MFDFDKLNIEFSHLFVLFVMN